MSVKCLGQPCTAGWHVPPVDFVQNQSCPRTTWQVLSRMAIAASSPSSYLDLKLALMLATLNPKP